MKKLLAVLSILAFLFVAGPVSADWVSDISLTEDVVFISVKFKDDKGTVVIKTKSGNCMEYYVVDNEIAKMRECNDTEWFVKKGI